MYEIYNGKDLQCPPLEGCGAAGSYFPWGHGKVMTFTIVRHDNGIEFESFSNSVVYTLRIFHHELQLRVRRSALPTLLTATALVSVLYLIRSSLNCA